MAALHRLMDHHPRHGFYCIEEEPVWDSGHTVIFVPGLGENRSGHNYLYTQLGRCLAVRGFRSYRFDLAGQGDSLLPLDPELWRSQVDQVRGLARTRGASVHIVARGVGVLALPVRHDDGHVFLIRPPYQSDCTAGNSLAATSVCGQVKPPQDGLTADEKRLLTAFGAEVRCIGGLTFTRSFLEDAVTRVGRYPAEWTSIFAAVETNSAPVGATVLPNTRTPLFLLASDRAALGQLLTSELRIA